MSEPRTDSPQIVVIGGGPAGLSAAAAAAELGASVSLLDENERPGGQLFKQIHKFFGSEAHHAGVRGFEIGRRLVRRAEETGVNLELNTVAFGIYEGLEIGAYTAGERARFVRPDRIILAVGATERALPFAGWTLPGVMGAGAAQTLMNIHRVLPGRRALIVGSGNVGLIVGFQFLQAGGEVAAVVEAAPSIGGYEVHAAKLRREGVPIYVGHSVVETHGSECVEGATIGALDDAGGFLPDSLRQIDADLILLAVGLTPQIELARMAGCEVLWSPVKGGHVVQCDENMRTTVPEVFCAGDVASIEEASTAMEEGALAGIACAESLGHGDRAQTEALKVECRSRLGQLRTGLGAEGRTPGAGKRVTVGRPVAVIECFQRIPCNPCESACRFGAIRIGDDINALPILDETKCTGCAECVRQCPGLAIFAVNADAGCGRATVTLPFELPNPPAVGESVTGLSREGEPVCEAEVTRVSPGRLPGETSLITLAVPQQSADAVRAFRRRQL